MIRTITYPFRRLYWWFITSNVACIEKLCARPQVGFSQYCRYHTDQILNATYAKARDYFNISASELKWFLNSDIENYRQNKISAGKLMEIIMVYLYKKRQIQEKK